MISGSILELKLNGVTYAVPADFSFEFTLSRVKNEGVATSGDTLVKKTRVVPEAKAACIASVSEADTLRGLAEGLTQIPISVKVADGSYLKGTGCIQFEKWSTEDYKGELTLIPKDKWEIFAASGS